MATVRQAAPASNKVMASASGAVRPLLTSCDGTSSMEARVSVWLGAVAVVVLIVACANVVNLVLARGLRRQREIAVRQAIGASRGRVIGLLTVEALVLAAAGGLVSVSVAYGVGTLMRTWFIPTVAWPSGPINVRVLAVSTALSVAAGFVVGLVPAWRTSRRDVSASLKTGVREGGGRHGRVRAALTVVQAALSALLLVGSGLFVASLAHVRAMDLGLQPDRVISFGISRAPLSASGDDAAQKVENARRKGFYPTVMERLAQQADVEAASLTIGLPFWSAFGEDIKVPGLDKLPTLKGGGPYLSAVTADYFRTVGTRIVRGRAFTPADRAGSAPVAIVNETMARTIWPGRDAVGQCFVINSGPACAEVVGVAADTRRFKLREDAALAFYIPFGQESGIGGVSLIVRPRGDATKVMAAIRRELLDLDPSITFVSTTLLQDRLEPQIRPWSLGATMFTLMGMLALVVAALGLYSVMAYTVSQRRHEIGVRVALGAGPSRVAALIARGGLALAVLGIAIGFGLAWLSSGYIEPLLFETSSRDPRVYAVVATTLVLMAVAASIVPAARARSISPMVAMREE
jgi:predicted permease